MSEQKIKKDLEKSEHNGMVAAIREIRKQTQHNKGYIQTVETPYGGE